MQPEPGPFPRSFLYVPATRPDLFDKAIRSGADAVILDLEDATPLPMRPQARSDVAVWLRSSDRDGAKAVGAVQIWVRVDPVTATEDLDAVVGPGIAGIMLAKCSRASLRRIANWSGKKVDQTLPVICLVETAEALLDLPALVRDPQVVTFGIGEVDLLGDLGMTRSPRTTGAVDALRTQVVMHCAAAGLQAPIAPTSTEFRDLEGFRESTRLMLELGFRSRTAVHPGQVGVINEVLTPTSTELEMARDVLDRFAAAGGGVTTDASGHLIDAAVVRHSRDVVGRGRNGSG